MGADCLAHVFWVVLYDSHRHFSNLLSPESSQSRYTDIEIFRLLGTRLVHMDEKLECNKTLMNVSVPRQWLGRGAASVAGYQPVGTIRKYQCG